MYLNLRVKYKNIHSAFKARKSLVVISEYFLSVFVVYLYCEITRQFHLKPTQFLEIFLVIFIIFIMNAILRENRIRPFIAGLPVVILYYLHDQYFKTFAIIPTLSTIKDLPDLFRDTELKDLLPYLLPVTAGILLFAVNIDPRKIRKFALRGSSFIVLASVIVFAPVGTMHLLASVTDMGVVGDIKSVRDNGRITTSIFNECKPYLFRAKLSMVRAAGHANSQDYTLPVSIMKAIKPKNVNIIVLESFTDPRFFSRVTFDRSPADESFTELVGGNMSISMSPHAMGGTGHSEFEVLCGVPAFTLTDNYDFNVFTGSESYCLPSILRSAGFITLATNASSPDNYNSRIAYASAGFDKEYYLPQNRIALDPPTYLVYDDLNGRRLADGSLLRQNLAFVSTLPDQRPILNYVLGIDGHFKIVLNPEKRPMFIHDSTNLEQFHELTNQFYYRSKAVAEFIKGLSKTSKDGLIVIVGDHPPHSVTFAGKGEKGNREEEGGSGAKFYTKYQYFNNVKNSNHMVPAIIVKDGKVVKYPFLHHYDIKKIVLDYLTDGAYCKAYECNFESPDRDRYMNEYMNILSLGSRKH